MVAIAVLIKISPFEVRKAPQGWGKSAVGIRSEKAHEAHQC
jgi:hypothetical protein